MDKPLLSPMEAIEALDVNDAGEKANLLFIGLHGKHMFDLDIKPFLISGKYKDLDPNPFTSKWISYVTAFVNADRIPGQPTDNFAELITENVQDACGHVLKFEDVQFLAIRNMIASEDYTDVVDLSESTIIQWATDADGCFDVAQVKHAMD